MLGFRFIKTEPTEHVIQFRNGQAVREGDGLAFHYFAPNSAIVLVPTATRAEPFIFQEVTADFQDVTVQGQVTYRIGDAPRLARMMNFAVDAKGAYVAEDPQKLPQRVIHQVQVATRNQLQALDLKQALVAGDALAAAVGGALRENNELVSLGIEILGLSVIAIKPKPETARALEAEMREELLRRADEAVYQRRNAAEAQERAIKENQLNTEIAVERKRRQVQETKLEAEQAAQEKRQQMQRQDMDNQVALEDKRKALVLLAAENARQDADAKAYGVDALMQAYAKVDARTLEALAMAGMDPARLIAGAFRNLAENADKIGALNITPDLLRQLMARAA